MGYQAIFNKITHASSLIEPSYKTTFQETALQRQLKQTQTLLSNHPAARVSATSIQGNSCLPWSLCCFYHRAFLTPNEQFLFHLTQALLHDKELFTLSMTDSYLWYLSRFSYNIPALWQSYKISIEVLLSQGQVSQWPGPAQSQSSLLKAYSQL